jgi:hypothetical protein
MKLAEEYLIAPLGYDAAMSLVVENHYLHRKCPCEKAFGLFSKKEKSSGLFADERLCGCVVYGTPSSAPLRKGICGESESDNVLELTRLWIEDGTPSNVESYLIGNTLKKLHKEIIVSYAEIAQGHTGVIYQATNWIYTGLSAKRTNWTVEGLDRHSQTLADKYTAKEIREIYGDKFSLQPRGRKHRCVFFNATKKRKKALHKKLRYAVKPYPKAEAITGQWENL